MIKIIIVLVVIVAIFVLVTYNSLTKEKNRLELAEQELEVVAETTIGCTHMVKDVLVARNVG